MSPSTRIVVPGSRIAPPWRSIEASIYLLRFMPNRYHVSIAGWSVVATLTAGWKYFHASEMLAFPLSVLLTRWSVRSGRARLALEAMMIGGLVLCAGFVRHGWVP